MDGDDRDRKVVLRHLEPVLDRDVVGAGGVLGRELPAPGPELDPGEAPERAGAPRLVRARATLGARARATREPRPSSTTARGCSRPPASPPAPAARRRRRSRSRVPAPGDPPAPPDRRRTSRGSPAPRERALGARRRRAPRRARALRERGRSHSLEARRPREAAVNDRLERRARRRLAQGLLEQVRSNDRRSRARRGGRGPRRATGRSPSRPAARSRSRAHASTPRQRGAREQRRALDDDARSPLVRRRQPERLLGELGRDSRRAAVGRQPRGVVEHARRPRRPGASVDSAR